MVRNKLDEFCNGVKPHMAGNVGVFMKAQIAKCAFLQCEHNALDGKYCDFHTKKYKQVSAAFRSRQSADFSKPQEFECVYVIGSDFFEPVKIGRSAAPLRRLADMQVGNPYKLRLLAALMMTKTETAFLEWDVHVTLYGMGFGVSGEWFDLDRDDASAVIAKCAEKAGITLRTPRQSLEIILGGHSPYSPEREWLDFRDRLQRMAQVVGC